jgi:hypothetical protein
MHTPRLRPAATPARRVGAVLVVLSALAAGTVADGLGPAGREAPFAQFGLPDEWEERFWADPDTKALLALDPKAVADLVPVQAGLRHCRCPSCDATEADDTLSWSIRKPDIVTCRRCGATVPNDEFPARDKDKKVPEEVVEVRPRVFHKYPYHAVAEEKQLYPEERLYLSAKRDYEAREFLAKAALYAAVRHHGQPPGARDPSLARLASVLILRFAQVYPSYATHYDQPGQPKYFQPADLPPPYRRGYRTAKWDWSGSLDVPLNLVIAYALIRDDPALAEAGQLLGDDRPSRTIERELFRASAEFVRLQPEEYGERSLAAYRGMLAVGRLLDDPALVHEALGRLEGFAERGFYHDGFWRQGDADAHRRVMAQIDGWIDRLLAGYSDPPNVVLSPGSRRIERVSRESDMPMLALAHEAASAPLLDPRSPEVQRAAWPPVTPTAFARHPALLGGAGLARLAVGQGETALDLEVRDQDSFGAPHFQRQALRLAVGGRTVLGDLDGLPPSPTGWDRATACHNTVVVDGLNQREAIARAADVVPGGNVLFFAADADFQVAMFQDLRAYPQSTTRYRQTVVAASGVRTSYAIAVFEVHGGLQHDQFFHAPAGSPARWEIPGPSSPAPSSLLPPSIAYVPTARAEDGRWFVQAYGELTPMEQMRLARPATARLARPDGIGVRLHLLGDMPVTLVTAVSPDPMAPSLPRPKEEWGRAGLMVRRRSEDGSTLESTFVTVFEPLGTPAPLVRVGRVSSPEGTVLVYLETEDGPEHVLINLEPGNTRAVSLARGQTLATDGLAVRVADDRLVLAGGTFAEAAPRRVVQQGVGGTIQQVVRHPSAGSRGYFLADGTVADPDALAGRTLLIRHGDGTARAWTLRRVENAPDGLRLHVREEPGFAIDPHRDEAHYYQFPGTTAPGPHHFRVSRMAR